MESTAAIADFMGGFTPSSDWEISKRGVIVDETHRIAEIQNNRMRFHEPLHANVNSSYGWEVHEYRFLEEVGVEDISFHGSWTGDFVHHKNYIHDYSWYMLQFRGCVNSWVRRVSFINTSIALGINGSAISVYHVTLAGNQGHFAFWGTRTTRGSVFQKTSQDINTVQIYRVHVPEMCTIVMIIPRHLTFTLKEAENLLLLCLTSPREAT